jgi:hypothetical protein
MLFIIFLRQVLSTTLHPRFACLYWFTEQCDRHKITILIISHDNTQEILRRNWFHYMMDSSCYTFQADPIHNVAFICCLNGEHRMKE